MGHRRERFCQRRIARTHRLARWTSAPTGERVALDVRPFYFGQFDMLGTTMGSPRDFAGLLRFLDEYDVLPPVVDRVFPLDEAAAAHRYLESGGGFGKVILEQSAPPEGPVR